MNIHGPYDDHYTRPLSKYELEMEAKLENARRVDILKLWAGMDAQRLERSKDPRTDEQIFEEEFSK